MEIPYVISLIPLEIPYLQPLRGVTEGEQSDSWEDASRYLSEYLAKKLGMDLYELDMQVSRVHRTPKSIYDNKCRPIFVQLVNWRDAEDICKQLIALHASKKSKVTVSQMFSKSLTNRRNQALLRRKEIMKESPYLSVFLDFPAKLMGKKRHSQEKYM